MQKNKLPYDAEAAAARLMGLRECDGKGDTDIFLPDFMPAASPQQVATRLREFAKAGKIRFRRDDFADHGGDEL